MKKLSLTVVLLCATLLATSCKSKNLPLQSDIESVNSETVKTETSIPQTESSEITVSSEISITESQEIGSDTSRPSSNVSSVSSKPAVSNKPPVSSQSKPTLDELKSENSKKAQEIIKKVTNDKMTDIEKAKTTYYWLYPNFRYRTTKVDLSNGYTDQLTHELANYFFRYRKGSCEHYAAAQKVLLEELGFECFYIEGERYSYWTKVWGEHTWLHVKYGEDIYHVDGLYGGLFYEGKMERMFMVPDKSVQKTHRWNKDTYLPCTKPQILK